MSTATPTVKSGFSAAWTAGADADDLDDALNESADVQVATAVAIQDRLARAGVAFNLVAGALTLLVTLIVVLLAALVGGEFAGAIPSDSVFSSAITTTTDNAGTAFVIFGVTLLAIPATAAVAYIIRNMGPIVSFGGRMGMR